MSKKTLVLGASTNPSRYSYLAVKKLRSFGHPVLAVGRDLGMVADVEVVSAFPKEAVDTVTLYLNPLRQKDYIEPILNLKPKRIIFNPGTENPEFEARAQEAGIETVEGCTLVMLDTKQF